MSAAAARPQILLVDDEAFNLELMANALSGQAYDVSTADSGRSALAQMKASLAGFDLVVLDRRMAPPDGFDVLRQMRTLPQQALTPVIIQTAVADPDAVAEGIAAGAYYYLTKPYRSNSLLTLVRAALANHAERTQLSLEARELRRTVGLLDAAQFRLRSVDEASALAHGLAVLCATPDLAAIGLSELLRNAVEHGNLGIGYETKAALVQSGRWRDEVDRRMRLPAYRDRRVWVEVRRAVESISITIRDEGEGFDWLPFMALSAERATQVNGRGISLACRLGFLSVEYRDGGREVTVICAPAVVCPG
ncbi:MAG TPA: response regulator [Denitromonas sp.]|uniref:response regulator n=1 Tax=Denitromonas sp. TaxID=2734609 RepID=UPI001DDF79CC|nr:response regulator [Rhodocyclaceae bacterium]MCP5221884.1 response regulator [Zoogloeaceae bacterium]HPR07510.1 response regulator [Denitromonas sp.]HQU89704.1 response regulator [Denitromonas sp.]HQV15613.1 response regulator [Denitromonas sp.]